MWIFPHKDHLQLVPIGAVLAPERTNPERGFSALHPGIPCPRFCHDGASLLRQQSIRTRQILFELYRFTGMKVIVLRIGLFSLEIL
jgi:hypothetical protein